MHRNLILGVCLVFALGAACGDDDDDDAAAGSGGSSAGTGSAGRAGSNASAGSGGSSAGGRAAAGSGGRATAGSAGSGGRSAAGSGGRAGAAGASGSEADGGAAVEKDIVETAIAAGSFTKLAQALTQADLVTTLKGAGPFTVFAPTDAAFAKLSAAPTGDALKTVLLYHVIAGKIEAAALKEGGAAETQAGTPVLFRLEGGAKINDAEITMTDIEATNGVIHVIDTVLVPPADDIPTTAMKAGNFTKLVSALTSAGLVDELQAKGPFTVFAPTDAAFDALGTAPTGDQLKNVLLYHVVNGAVGAGDLKAGSVATLLADKSVTVELNNGAKVNTANVTQTNILTKNGLIHVIDRVLVPN